MATEHLVACKLIQSYSQGDFGIEWEKDVSLPFFPRQGDCILCEGLIFSRAVSKSHWCLETGMATAWLEDAVVRDFDWTKHIRMMVSLGWKVWSEDIPEPHRKALAKYKPRKRP